MILIRAIRDAMLNDLVARTVGMLPVSLPKIFIDAMNTLVNSGNGGD